MSHTIASVSQATYLPKERGPGISAVQSQPSFGFEENDAFERASTTASTPKPKDHSSEANAPHNPLYRLILMFRRLVQRLKGLFVRESLS